MSENTNTLLSDKIFCNFLNLLSKYKYVIFGTLVAGFLSYTFLFTNKIPNHDDVSALFGKGATIESGRWGLTLLSYVFPDFSMPWIYGCISLGIIAAGNCVLVRLFHIRSAILQFLIGAIVVSFPSQIGTFAYMFTAASYAVSYLLAVSAVSLWNTGRKKDWFLGLMFLVISISIYQSYLAVAASVLIVILIQQTIETDQTARRIFTKGIAAVVFLVCALALYWLATNLIWKYTATGLGEYAGGAVIFSIESIVERIQVAYSRVWGMLRYRDCMLITSQLAHYVHFACIGLIVLNLLICLIKYEKHAPRILLLILLLILLPLGIGCMYIFVGAGSVHTLVMLSFVSLYLLFAVVIEASVLTPVALPIVSKLRDISLDGIILGMCIIVGSNIYTANEASLNMKLAYEHTYSFASSVITQLQNTESYSGDDQVAIVGKYSRPDFMNEQFSHLRALMGVNGINPGNYSISLFFEYYHGYPMNWVTEEEQKQLARSEAVLDMPSYPDHGYISKVGDTFVIKLSDPKIE